MIPVAKDPAIVTRADKEFANHLDFKGTKFPATAKDYHRIETKNNISINVFMYVKGYTDLV